jgi:hypothetical protein
MHKIEPEVLPGGIAVISGGTRTRINLNRPWQSELLADPSTCPFENTNEEEARFDIDGGWRVLSNRCTPFSWHKLIIPMHCWPPEKLRTLGGSESIVAALDIAQSLTLASEEETWLGVHIGRSAGQNVGHLHYHLIHPLDRVRDASSENEIFNLRDESRILLRNAGCEVVVGGCRAGQCFFFPAGVDCENRAIAFAAQQVITLYGQKFKSEQGMPPDYMLSFVYRRKRLVYGSYVPVLNNWGFTEYLGLIENRPLVLPWPHEETLRHLREP